MPIVIQRQQTPLALPERAPNGQPESTTMLKGKHETLDAAKARLKKVSQEFESFISYYMLKSMRSTIASSEEAGPLTSGFGKETFTEMFDMELSKKMASGNSRSLSGMLYKSLERVLDAQYTGMKPEPVQYQDPLELHEPKSMPLQRTKPTNINSRMPLQAADHAAAEQLSADLVLSQPQLYPQTVSSVPSVAKKSVTYERPSPVKPQLQPVKTVAEPKEQGTPIKSTPANKSIGLDDIIEKAAHEHGLDSALIRSVITVESNGNPKAVSRAGAKGLMQLMDSVVDEYDVTDAFDPAENVTAGAAHLKRLITRFGDIKLGLAAYNAGPGNVKKYNGIPPFAETEQYVEKVLDAYSRFKSTQADPKVNSQTVDINHE